MSHRLKRTLLGCVFAWNVSLAYGWSAAPVPWSRQSPPTITACRLSRGRHTQKEDNDAYSWKNPKYSPYYNDEKYSEADYYYQDDQDTASATASTFQQKDVLQWEFCPTDAGDVQILLPPLAVERPSTILHFVGGTFFGSAPALWYRQLLEDLVRHTQSVVVATSIPVTVFQSPLQHVTLARKIQGQFQVAWREVLLEEYGAEVLEHIPVCGVGHSLGSRLLVVLETLNKNDKQVSSSRSLRNLSPPEYKAYILISFTNYGAAAGIPGMNQLSKLSRHVEKEAATTQHTESYRNGDMNRRNERWRVGDDGWFHDDDDDDEEEWGEILDDLQANIREQAIKVKSVLTPASSDLEFYPSPEQLWRALDEDKRYHIPQTLVVQFDDDDIDQSVQITQAIKDTSDVKFARLRGTHLTPISAKGKSGGSNSSNRWMQKINARARQVFGKVVLSRSRKRRQLRSNEELLQDLRQSIARYVTEVVTKL